MMVDDEGKKTTFDLESKDPNPEQLLMKKQRIKILTKDCRSVETKI